MRLISVVTAIILAGCSSYNHSFVVNTEKADKEITKVEVTICGQKPNTLQQFGKQFVGRVAAKCEGQGSVLITNTDGTSISCPIAYLTSSDDWWVFDVGVNVCSAKQKGEPYVG